MLISRYASNRDNFGEMGCLPHRAFVVQASEDDLKRTFLVFDKKLNSYRIPKTNETCCRRGKLAQVLEDGTVERFVEFLLRI